MERSADWLELVAKDHDKWIKIVESFGENQYQHDIVQEAYLALYKYTTPEKIIHNGKVSQGYIYFTLKTITYQFYNAKNKIQKVSLDDEENVIQLVAENDIEEQEAFHKICTLIDQEMESWSWLTTGALPTGMKRQARRHRFLRLAGPLSKRDWPMLSECGSCPPPAAFVYKVFDGNVLLYVGITENVQRRMKEHSRGKDWWPSSPAVVVNFFFDIRDAQDKERSLIAELEPIHDRTWRRKAPKGPMPKSVYVCPKCKVEKSLARPGVCTCNGRLNKRRADHGR